MEFKHIKRVRKAKNDTVFNFRYYPNPEFEPNWSYKTRIEKLKPKNHLIPFQVIMELNEGKYIFNDNVSLEFYKRCLLANGGRQVLSMLAKDCLYSAQYSLAKKKKDVNKELVKNFINFVAGVWSNATTDYIQSEFDELWSSYTSKLT